MTKAKTKKPITESDLFEMELYYEHYDSPLTSDALRLIAEVRRLREELASKEGGSTKCGKCEIYKRGLNEIIEGGADDLFESNAVAIAKETIEIGS